MLEEGSASPAWGQLWHWGSSKETSPKPREGCRKSWHSPAAPAGPAARHCGCTRGDSGHFCTLLHPISGQPGGGSPGGHQPRGRTCPAVGEGHVWAQVCAAPLRQGHVGASAFSADYRAGQLLPQESHPSQHSCLSSASPTRGSVGQERWHSPTSPLPGAAGTLWGPESG